MLFATARRLRRLSISLRLDRDWWIFVVAALIGVVMSGVAIAFMAPLRAVERLAEESDPGWLWWLVPTVPVVGATLAGVVLHVIPSSGKGPGITNVMYAIYRHKGRIPPYIAARKWIASTLTIGSGGSAGPEGPIVTIGAVIGSTISRVMRVNPQSTSTLLGCGAAAGLASVFNAPIAGVFFVMEVLLRDFSLRTLTPIVIASVVSTAFTQWVLGTDALFATTGAFSVDVFTWKEIPNYLMLGLVCGVLAAAFIRALYLAFSLFSRIRIHPILRPAIGAVGLGLLGLVYLLLGGPKTGMPHFYGNGYSVITDLLRPAWYDGSGAVGAPVTGGQILLLLVALGVLKALATSLTIGSGGAGGLFAPSLLVGASVGGAFGFVVNQLDWFPAASPAHYALVGMAAMLAATTHAPLTAMLMVYEITQSYEVILPIMLAAVISTIVGRLVYRESVYTVRLTDQGVRVGAMSDLTILRRLAVSDVPLGRAVAVHPSDSAQRLLDLSEEWQVSDFVVEDASGKYLGLVTASDLKAALVFREAVPLLQVSELQRSDVPTATPDETLDVVLDKFARHDVQSLAVLDAHGEGAVLGLVTRDRLIRRYQAALEED